MAERNKSGRTARIVDKTTTDIFSPEFISRLQKEAAAAYQANKKANEIILKGLFKYQGVIYIECVPSQHLMRSTYLYNNVSSGGITAIRLHDNKLVTIPKGESISPMEDKILS